MISKPSINDAIISLVPNASFSIIDNEIIWINTPKPQITREEIDLELERLLDEYNKKEYERLRSLSYPSIYEYIDGIVKNDQEQINKYIQDCLDVKLKYPKPEN